MIEDSVAEWIDGGLLFPGVRSPTANGVDNRGQRRIEAPPLAGTSFLTSGLLVWEVRSGEAGMMGQTSQT